MLSLFSTRRAMLPALASAACALLFAAQSFSIVHADDAKPFLHPLFTDNMVLQRGQTDPIWGWTTPGQTVTVSVSRQFAQAVAGQTVTVSVSRQFAQAVAGPTITVMVGKQPAPVVAGPDGKWMAKIGPLAVGETYTVTVSGPQTVTLKNVLVGDVWLCSGQSNMEFGIGNAINADAEIAAANYPNIHLLMLDNKTASTPQQTFTGGPWTVCTPENVHKGGWNGFSAVGYFFARNLYQNQHVPIGLIESDWGGTPAEAWTSAEALSTMPDFRAQVAAERNPSGYPAAVAAWYAKHDAGSSGTLWGDPNYNTSSWKTMPLPIDWEQSGIAELSNFHGIVWFRKTFDLPAGNAGKDAVLHFMADDNDTTWVNGTLVGATQGYNTVRAYAIPSALLKPTGNTIAVRVLDTGGGGGIWGDPAGLNLSFSGGLPIPLAGPWSYHIGGPLPTDDPLPVMPGNDQNSPATLYNAMIAPLIPSGIKGALWYQGEANAGNATQYRTLLPTMIGDWHTRFGQGNFPFLIVQLAGWTPGGDAWADLRQAQWLTAKTVPNAGIATAIDVGDSADIHPKNKQEVGRRLALVAEAQVYAQKVEDSGPVYKALKVEGSTVRLSFDHLGGGLVAKDGKPLTAFVIAGADGKFVPADAKIDGGTVVVSSPSVPTPTAVRYAWSAFPENSLYNKAGLPTFPFDTGGK